MGVITSTEWIKLFLGKMGIDPSTVTRVVIDAVPSAPLMVYVSYCGTDALLDVRPPRAEEVDIVFTHNLEAEENGILS